MTEPLFTWLHLSDIHVGHGKPAHLWDQKMVLDEIANDVVAARTEGAGIPAPDAILVTGDVAFSGSGHEYAKAREWLLHVAGSLGLSASDVFVVPGNHDVDRKKDDDRNCARLVRGLQGGDDLDTALGDGPDRKLLAGRMEAYLAFAADLAPAGLAPARLPPEERLWWWHRITRGRGLTVRLVGLNSSLLCSGTPDPGHLRLGNEQFVECFVAQRIAGERELVIALTHHPFAGWLADARDADAKLRKYAHLHLSGHVHEAQSEDSRTGGASGGFVRVVAGASHAEKQASSEIPSGHGYNFASVVADDDGALHLRVWPRRWSDANRDFRPDVERLPRGKSWAEHALSVRCGPPAAAPAGTGPATAPPVVTPAGVAPTATTPTAKTPAAPVEVVIFHSPQDLDMLKALETHLALARKMGVIASFSARDVELGAAEGETLAARVDAARIFLVLVTSSFLDTHFFDSPEFGRALARAKRKEARLVCIYARPCDWEGTWMHDDLRWLPFPDQEGKQKAVSEGNLDVAFKQVSEELRRLVKEMQKGA